MLRNKIHPEGEIKGAQSTAVGSLRFLVPVDFTDRSYNALGYTLQLAKMCNGSIELFPMAEDIPLPQSESPLTLRHALTAGESKMNRKIESLKEIIKDNGVEVTCGDIQHGAIAAALTDQLSVTRPDVVVVGGGTTSGVFARVATEAKTALLVVPPTLQITVPRKVLLLRDEDAVREESLRPLFSIVHNGSKQLRVVGKKKGSFTKLIFKYLLPVEEFEVGVNRSFDVQSTLTDDVDAFLQKEKPDMICRLVRPPSFWQRIAWPWRDATLSNRVDVPTLFITD
ncbi:MAG: universal stress protein [Cyclobacteriaceae bacterium]